MCEEWTEEDERRFRESQRPAVPYEPPAQPPVTPVKEPEPVPA